MVSIRPFTSSDNTAVKTILNEAIPEIPVTLEALSTQYQNRSPSSKLQRLVAIYDGHVVAYGLYDQPYQLYYPRTFLIYIVVHPHYEYKGIGSAMYEYIINSLQPFNPLSLRAFASEIRKRSIDFLNSRGFQETKREYILSLDVRRVDPAQYAEIEERLVTQSVKIKTLREIKVDHDYADKLHKLYNNLVQGMPASESVTSVPFTYFMKHMLNNTNSLPEAYFVAVHDNEYIGMNVLHSKPEENNLFNEFTGVLQQYRHKRIALALKLRGIAYARENRYSTIKTYNNASNESILKINEHLGFVKEPATITFEKILGN